MQHVTRTAIYRTLSIVGVSILSQHPVEGSSKVSLRHAFNIGYYQHYEQLVTPIFHEDFFEPTFIIRKQNRHDAITSTKAMHNREINMDGRQWRNIRQAHCRSKWRDENRVRKQKLRTA